MTMLKYLRVHIHRQQKGLQKHSKSDINSNNQLRGKWDEFIPEIPELAQTVYFQAETFKRLFTHFGELMHLLNIKPSTLRTNFVEK